MKTEIIQFESSEDNDLEICVMCIESIKEIKDYDPDRKNVENAVGPLHNKCYFDAYYKGRGVNKFFLFDK